MESTGPPATASLAGTLRRPPASPPPFTPWSAELRPPGEDTGGSKVLKGSRRSQRPPLIRAQATNPITQARTPTPTIKRRELRDDDLVVLIWIQHCLAFQRPSIDSTTTGSRRLTVEPTNRNVPSGGAVTHALGKWSPRQLERATTRRGATARLTSLDRQWHRGMPSQPSEWVGPPCHRRLTAPPRLTPPAAPTAAPSAASARRYRRARAGSAGRPAPAARRRPTAPSSASARRGRSTG